MQLPPNGQVCIGLRMLKACACASVWLSPTELSLLATCTFMASPHRPAASSKQSRGPGTFNGSGSPLDPGTDVGVDSSGPGNC
eukprot:scaffold7747_cov363-Prasinococcus_capsulatus_cf.AAC.1